MRCVHGVTFEDTGERRFYHAKGTGWVEGTRGSYTHPEMIRRKHGSVVLVKPVLTSKSAGQSATTNTALAHELVHVIVRTDPAPQRKKERKRDNDCREKRLMQRWHPNREGSRVPNERIAVIPGDLCLHGADYHSQPGSGAVEEGPATRTQLEASESRGKAQRQRYFSASHRALLVI